MGVGKLGGRWRCRRCALHPTWNPMLPQLRDERSYGCPGCSRAQISRSSASCSSASEQNAVFCVDSSTSSAAVLDGSVVRTDARPAAPPPPCGTKLPSSPLMREQNRKLLGREGVRGNGKGRQAMGCRESGYEETGQKTRIVMAGVFKQPTKANGQTAMAGWVNESLG